MKNIYKILIFVPLLYSCINNEKPEPDPQPIYIREYLKVIDFIKVSIEKDSLTKDYKGDFIVNKFRGYVF